MKKVLEVCVDSLASARAAIRGGADRLELCSALPLGGLTPHFELLRQIRLESNIPIRCLIRPRPGDFCYTTDEIRLMTAQIESLSTSGADGFVIGILNAEGQLDENAMEPLFRAAVDKPLTLHRCIDVSRDLQDTYRHATDLGFDTVLTSGGKSNCRLGKDVIIDLVSLQDRLDGACVMAGAGVNNHVIAEFRADIPDLAAFHMSGRKNMDSAMVFRREGVPMGIPGFDEWGISQTDETVVSLARAALV